MNRLIHHRGPDGNGIFTEDNVGLGNTRLAIIDLRHLADQPMFDFDERYVITYNGEIFNFVELRDELVKKGYKFKTNSDTEVILNSYKEYGEECLHKLNGMWAFAIWDRNEKSLFCSRDRYGIKPFYYYKDNEKFIFSSEIKQILSCGLQKGVNDNMIYDFLIFNFLDHTEETFFKNIFKLPAGFKINVRKNEFIVSRWYNLPQEVDEGLNADTLYKNFYDLIYDSVKVRLRSDVEVGSCLSGGIDSSSIVCLMHNILNDEGKTHMQKTFTACYDEPLIDERKFVEEVIKQTNSAKYYLFPDSESFVKDLDRMVWHQDEPIAGATVFAQWCVFKKINETKIKVVLDGQGSDEILLGYFSFFPFYLKRLLSNPFNFISQYFKGVSTTGLGFVDFTENFFYFNSPSVRYKHVKNNGRKVFKDEFIDSFNRREIFNRMVAASNIKANRLSNLWNISLPSLLRYEDKNSMAFSVEARLPFLDHRLVEFVFSIPYQYLIKNGWTKYVLRESMNTKIPEDIRLRKGKLAFTVPQKKWLNEISDYVIKNFNEDFRASKYIDMQKILKAISSRNYNDKVLFRAFALEKWLKVFGVN